MGEWLYFGCRDVSKNKPDITLPPPLFDEEENIMEKGSSAYWFLCEETNAIAISNRPVRNPNPEKLRKHLVSIREEEGSQKSWIPKTFFKNSERNSSDRTEFDNKETIFFATTKSMVDNDPPICYLLKKGQLPEPHDWVKKNEYIERLLADNIIQISDLLTPIEEGRDFLRIYGFAKPTYKHSDSETTYLSDSETTYKRLLDIPESVRDTVISEDGVVYWYYDPEENLLALANSPRTEANLLPLKGHPIYEPSVFVPSEAIDVFKGVIESDDLLIFLASDEMVEGEVKLMYLLTEDQINIRLNGSIEPAEI